MKHSLRLSLLLASFFCLSASRAQVANPDSMVRKLFATLPANDQNGFVALYPSPQQLVELVKSIMQSDEVQKQLALSGAAQKINIDSIIQAQMTALTKPEVMAEMTKGFAKNFQRTMEGGEAKKIDWTKAQFISYRTDTAASGTDNDEAMLQKLGYKTMKGVIDFSVDTALYQMQFKKVLFIPKAASWYGGEFGQIVRKGENFGENEGPLTDSIDSVRISPPAKTKSKSKTGHSKTETRFKSPARKPGSTS